jgi:alginate O-acetyltransferase complex protein AlgJ
MKDPAANKIYSAIFCILIFFFLLLQLTGTGLTLDSISDNFLWRMALIEKINAMRFAAGDTIFNEGLMGREGWLFYTGDFSIHDYQKTELLRPGRLYELGEILVQLDNKTSAHGGSLWVVNPPDKNTIYPQYMPAQIPVIGQTSRLDQVIEYLKENTKVKALDLRPLFIEISQSSQIYYKKDAHWNCLGAYYAANEILTQVSALHPEVQANPLSDYEAGVMSDSTLDIARVMGVTLMEDTVTLTPQFRPGSITHIKYERYSGMNVALNSQTELPTAMFIHDSFYTECLNQFIEPQFSRVIFTHFEDSLLSEITDVIETEKPDVVVVEFAERHIEYFFRLVTRQTR